MQHNDKLRAAFDAYRDDFKQLVDIEKRLLKQTRGKRAELNYKTLQAQHNKCLEGFEDATKSYHDRVDSVYADIVTKIRALCSLGASQGAGVKLVLSECEDFASAKGFEDRDRIFAGLVSTLEAVAETQKTDPASFSDRTRSGGEQITHCESKALPDGHPLWRSVPPQPNNPFSIKF